MGQSSSTQIQEFVPPFLAQILNEDSSNSIISLEIQSMTYEQFLDILGELNVLSQKCLDSTGKKLVFAVKKGTDSTVFWKATVQIACVKVDPETNKVDTYRLLSLSEFVRIFKTLKCQYTAAQQSSSNYKAMTTSTLLDSIDSNNDSSSNLEQATECCICLERKPEVLLPCAHSYCLQCIEEWNESHDTCPICRGKLESTEDSWILSEVPNAEEISAEIRSDLMNLTKERTPPCSPS